MISMRIRNISGYSPQTASKYADIDAKFIILTTEPEESVVWKDNQPTEVVNGYKYWFIQVDGQEPFQVKFKKKLQSISFLDQVGLKHLEACEINRNVYFKADGID